MAIKVLRGARILRVFKSLHELQELLYTLYKSVKSFSYVIFLSFLTLFVFALIGMRAFGDIKKGYYKAINDQSNFHDVWYALYTLAMAETGEGWNMLMYDTIQAKGAFACVYWIIFVIIKMYVILNVLTAIIFHKLEVNTR